MDNRIGELTALAAEIEVLASEWELDEALAMNLNLVLEEAVSNIIFYGFSDEDLHKITISVTRDSGSLTLRIVDDGIPFDPTSRTMLDISGPAEERPIGGLGILLISRLMDQVSYARVNNQNVLTLIKNI